MWDGQGPGQVWGGTGQEAEGKAGGIREGCPRPLGRICWEAQEGPGVVPHSPGPWLHALEMGSPGRASLRKLQN